MRSVENFYDTFASQQEAMGINLRHNAIDKWCTKFELQPTDNVLVSPETITAFKACDAVNAYDELAIVDVVFVLP